MATAGTKQAWARGGTIFAATLLLLIGVFQFFVGIAAIVQNNFFVVGANYTYEIDTTTWGWIHLAIGVLAAITGFVLFTGATWARMVAIAIAAISAVANFFFLPYYPLWSLLIIALDVFAIWAVSHVRRSDFEPTGTTEAMNAGMQPGMQPAMQSGMQQPGMQSGMASPAGMAAGSGQRWPENPGMQPTGAGMQQDTAQTGRHWAPDNVKDGTGTAQGMDPAQQAAAQQAQQEAQQRGQRS